MRFVPQIQRFYTQESSESGLFLACITETFIYSLLYPEERQPGIEPWNFDNSGGLPAHSRELLQLLFQGLKKVNEGRRSRFPVIMYPLDYLPVLTEICRQREQPS
jgi:hypothetical protein